MPAVVEIVSVERVKTELGSRLQIVFESTDREALTSPATKERAIDIAEEKGIPNAAINGLPRVVPVMPTGDKVTQPDQPFGAFRITYLLG